MSFSDRIAPVLDSMAGIIIVSVLLLFGFTTVYPHFASVPAENQQMLAQQNATLQNILLVIVAFFFGQSQGNLKKDHTIAGLVERPPSPPAPPIVVAPGSTIEATSSLEVKDASPN